MSLSDKTKAAYREDWLDACDLLNKQDARLSELQAKHDRLQEALETILEIDWTRPGQGGVVTDIAQEALTSQANMSGRIERDRLREALQNIADGDTPWMDGYSETPGEVYQKYAKSIIDNVG